jgi:phosphoenolpyruvate carboxykinase (ATP)
MDINLTRAIVEAALNGSLSEAPCEKDPLFHYHVPNQCPGVDSEVLSPRNTWADKNAYDLRAKKLAADFSSHFDKAYGGKGIDPAVEAQCPGK